VFRFTLGRGLMFRLSKANKPKATKKAATFQPRPLVKKRVATEHLPDWLRSRRESALKA
jgi:hypothetical protein